MFKKPNGKSVTNAVATAGAFVVGAKVGDGVSALMPASTDGYKRLILGVGGIIAAACINPSTTMAQGAQNAFLGLGAKQLYDELSDTLTDAIPIKAATATEPLGTTDKFLNAIVGHKDVATAALGSAWEGDNADDIWSRPLGEPFTYEEEQPVLFVGA